MRAAVLSLLLVSSAAVSVKQQDVLKKDDAKADLSSFMSLVPGLLGREDNHIPESAWDASFHPKLMENYAQYAQDPKVKTICETGFGSGISSLFWLNSAPNATLHTFDTEFPSSAVEFLQQRFGRERVMLHPGNSRDTLPTFGALCDIVSVDGDHSKGGSFNDIQLLHKNAHSDTVLLADDMFNLKQFVDPCTTNCLECDCKTHGFANEVSRGWIDHVKTDLIQTMGCTSLEMLDKEGLPKGFCHGRFLGTKSTCKKGVKCMMKNAVKPIYCGYMAAFKHYHC